MIANLTRQLVQTASKWDFLATFPSTTRHIALEMSVCRVDQDGVIRQVSVE